MTPASGLSAILCADWGKEFPKRAVYVAEVSRRVIRRIPGVGWSVTRVLEEAERWTPTGSVLATFDAPLGVPQSYLHALSRLPSEHPPTTFLELLVQARVMPRFFTGSGTAGEWRVDRPFFAVPGGAGGLRSYVDAAARHRVSLYRRIDGLTGAKSVFITSGIPGSVGSAACALWQELALQLTPGRTFKVWPFEGDLEELLQSAPIILGEIYPRAAYATALLDTPPSSRAPLVIGKTDAGVRHEAVASLRNARWVRGLQVTVEDLEAAEANEDDFDACLTAAALLRCVLEGAPLCPSQLDASASEGGILGTGSVNLQLRQQTFSTSDRDRGFSAKAVAQRADRPGGRVAAPSRVGTRVFPCPIPGCDKTFQGSRGGWDAHVAFLRFHPGWHPDP